MKRSLMSARGPTLLSRYRQVFLAAWRERHIDPAFLLTADEADFSPPALALTERPVSPTARMTAALLIGLVTATLAWASLGRLSIDANAVGQVIPSTGTKTIAAVETAVVRAIDVREGEAVKAGQVLVRLDASPFRADYRKAIAEERTANLAMARSSALIAAIATHEVPQLRSVAGTSAAEVRQARLHLAARYAAFTAKLAELDAAVAQYRQALPVAREREQIYARLLRTHDVSRDDWLAREQKQLDLAGRLADARAARAAFVAQTRREAYGAFTAAAQSAAIARQEAARAASQATWFTLRSPVNGTVQQLTVHTVGGVVPAAQPLMRVVPAQEQMQVQVYLQNKDVGFVRVGQQAKVKVAAFDYTRYGTIPGRVVSVSRDALEGSDSPEAGARRQRGSGTGGGDSGARYLVRVALQRSVMKVDGRAVPLLPGMAVMAEIKTGRRRVIEYFLSPLLRQGTDSLHER
jgi:hemolysin D